MADTLAAVEAALGPPGGVATLVLPADVSWLELDESPPACRSPSRPATRRCSRSTATSCRSCRLPPFAPVSRPPSCSAARRSGAARSSPPADVAERAGARLLAEPFPARLERGAGLPGVERLAYLGEIAMAQMAGLSHLLLVDARSPVSPFAYPGRSRASSCRTAARSRARRRE